jgi:uncharacterized protein YecT (DUF1311 family)
MYKSLPYRLSTYVILLLTVTSVTRAQDCPKLTIADFPKKDLPAASFTGKEGFRSTNYYYGIGVPVNYRIARYLAFKEFSTDTDNPLEGAAILLMLYANGYEVKQDLNLCIRLACGNVGGAPAEISGRTEHLKGMQPNSRKDVFDICDDITSGYMMGFCQSIVTEKNEYRRKAAVARILRTWSAKDTTAFGRLRIAATEFFDARCINEVDASGTARAAMSWEESDSLEHNFYDKIVKANKCAFRYAASSEFVRADSELNATYKKVMHSTDQVWGTVTTDGIKQTQRAWLNYRDAWVAFGSVRCAGISPETWKTILTRERISQLKGFLEE